jgi:hypothetical protein
MKLILSFIMVICLLFSFSNTYAKGQILLYKLNVVKCATTDTDMDQGKILVIRHR